MWVGLCLPVPHSQHDLLSTPTSLWIIPRTCPVPISFKTWELGSSHSLCLKYFSPGFSYIWFLLVEMSLLWVVYLVLLSKIGPSIFLHHRTPFLIGYSQLIITDLLTCCLRSGSLGIDPEKSVQVQWFIKEMLPGKQVRVWGKQNRDEEAGK